MLVCVIIANLIEELDRHMQANIDISKRHFSNKEKEKILEK